MILKVKELEAKLNELNNIKDDKQMHKMKQLCTFHVSVLLVVSFRQGRFAEEACLTQESVQL